MLLGLKLVLFLILLVFFKDFSESFDPYVYANNKNAWRQNYMVIMAWSRIIVYLKHEISPNGWIVASKSKLIDRSIKVDMELLDFIFA
jgi:hypothetical protein